ncbi:uncharacterized protein LOC108739346 isoform X2 [Agrilus planipennis]|uniref:Uncharacterized protein LOC108739346 isoform X2 n=1 Tax=Agrilus planipennis TaxID=224129 RepID=A0A1W4WXV3_AGRPL|nr:uncharacterized protein LOC108739346 isoform X2 [Agrilus planipennis]
MRVSTSSNGRCWGRRLPIRNLFGRFLNELSERLRLRRGRGDTSEDDEGLPHSPCNSPTTTDSPFVPINDHNTKSHSTCSDGSLLSMGSSDTEEDSIGLQSSRHSSKVSLFEKKIIEKQDSDFGIGLTSISTPLNHAAAHHRVAVRPKRTHGAPRRKNIQQLSGTTLPTTPEVNEEWSANRSLTPESTKEIFSEINAGMNLSSNRTQVSNETRLKCSSLPPGLAGPEDLSKLSRSQSSVGSKSQNSIGPVEEGHEEKDQKSHSIFGRFFPRRSGRKKKATSKQETVSIFPYSSAQLQTNRSIKTNVSVKPTLLQRTGPAARQRVQPIDIPASPELMNRHTEQHGAPKASPEILTGTSPLQQELQNHFKNHAFTVNANGAKPPRPPVESPKSPKLLKEETKIKHFENRGEFKTKHFDMKEECMHKPKITGLSSLQQRAMHHNYELDEIGFKSLTDLPSNETLIEHKSVAKSHSFKDDSNKENSSRDIQTKYETTETPQEIVNAEKQLFHRLDSNESINSINSNRTSSTEYLDSLTTNNDVIVCGPSHKAVVSVCNTSESEKNCFIRSIESESVIEEKTERYIQTDEQKNVNEIAAKEKNMQEQTNKEQRISVTKIQLKQTCNSSNFKKSIPEFLNIQLNKVDPKPIKNIVLTANLHSPKNVDSDVEHKLKNTFNFEMISPKLDNRRRRFSRDEIEIFEKDNCPNDSKKSPTDSISALSSPTSNHFYKKNADDQFQYPPPIKKCNEEIKSCKSLLKSKSNSLEIVDCIRKSPDDLDIKSLQSSLDKLDCTKSEISNSSRTSSASSLQNGVISDCITYRRKSGGRKREEDEPELMKVFARRSLKIKDEDEEILQEEIRKFKKEDLTVDTNSLKSRDSDKENQHDSPLESRTLPFRDKDANRLAVVENIRESEKAIKEPSQNDSVEVIFRKPFNNKFSGFPRSTSLNMPRVQESIVQGKIHTHGSFAEKSKTEKIDTNSKSWINISKQQEDIKEQVFKTIIQSEVIHDISTKSDLENKDFPTLPKNFIQRKAEWEKRAQEALKKKSP